MAINLVASTTLAGTNGGTSSAVDTTGANLLVLSAAYFSTITVSDSKGNTWVPLTVRGSGPIHQLFFVASPVVGTGHTFTVTGTGIYVGVVVHAYNGSGGPPTFQLMSY